MKTKIWFIILIIISSAIILTCSSEQEKMTRDFKQFLIEYEQNVIPLTKESNLAYFQATTTGDDKLYQKMESLEVKLSQIYANKGDFDRLKKIQESDALADELLRRQLDLLYNQYLSKQIPEDQLQKMIALQTDLEKRFSTFRAVIDDKKYTDNQIEEILRTSRNSVLLEKAWKASKQVGKLVAEDVLQLVQMRNATAKELGFDNYHSMQLSLSEQDPQQIEILFNELDELTRQSFVQLKNQIDNFLAKRYKVRVRNLRPWHYQNRFFQEAPRIYQVDLDRFYRNENIVDITRKYFSGIGLPIDDLIARSDLFEREGKYQHAYCTDIDRLGDVRVVCNVAPDQYWMNTLLHEYGHAVYDKFNDRDLPWTLRQPAHTFTTEAIAIMFGSFASNPNWLRDILKVPASQINKIADNSFKIQRLETLVFSRWAQVMYRFEKAMYENPSQDLNQLWWELVEKYQLVEVPADRNEPDWASKIHVALYPAYYHNYLMGYILASQLYYYISKEILETENVTGQSFHNEKKVGNYLVEKLFKPGSRYNWNDMIEQATGEKLTAKYYARQFIE
jgi:peptidyl-dipeptidase A